MLRPAKVMMNKTLELGEGLWLDFSLCAYFDESQKTVFYKIYPTIKKIISWQHNQEKGHTHNKSSFYRKILIVIQCSTFYSKYTITNLA